MKMMDEFAKSLAHDLNNIFLPITTITQVVLDDLPEDSEIWRNLNKVLSAAGQGRELAAKIKAVSVPDTKNFRRIDLRAPVLDALKNLETHIPSNVIFKSNLMDVGPILGDEGQIREMLWILGSNALEAIGDDDGTLEISLQPIENRNPSAIPSQLLKPGRYAKLSVKDSSGGLEHAMVPMIFNPYFSTKSPGQGTGLSLSMVYRMILAHDGDICVLTEPQVSTTFELYFPVLEFPTP